MTHYIDFDSLQIGDALPALTKDPITKVQLVRYAGASGDFNPLHTDDQVALAAGMKGVIAQGILIMGFMGQAISGWVQLRHLKRFKVRFKGVTYPGDVITVKAWSGKAMCQAKGRSSCATSSLKIRTGKPRFLENLRC